MARNRVFLKLEEDFTRYLLGVRGLRYRTIEDYVPIFRRFGNFLKSKGVSAARRITLNLAYEFFEKLAAGCSRKSIKTIGVTVRHILRFLYFTGELSNDLSKQIITSRVWNLADVPKSFTESETARMIENLRYETPYDRRESAIALLLICYGLRRGELANIMMDDIDWQSKTITIHERKNGPPLVLPILPSVEKALKDYLAYSRPKELKTRRLWISIHLRNKTPLNERGIHRVVKKFLRRCGTDGSVTKFRHTLATYLINSGVSLNAIGELLGHQSLDSTRIYAKVHWEALREVAQNYSLDM